MMQVNGGVRPGVPMQAAQQGRIYQAIGDDGQVRHISIDTVPVEQRAQFMEEQTKRWQQHQQNVAYQQQQQQILIANANAQAQAQAQAQSVQGGPRDAKIAGQRQLGVGARQSPRPTVMAVAAPPGTLGPGEQLYIDQTGRQFRAPIGWQPPPAGVQQMHPQQQQYALRMTPTPQQQMAHAQMQDPALAHMSLEQRQMIVNQQQISQQQSFIDQQEIARRQQQLAMQQHQQHQQHQRLSQTPSAPSPLNPVHVAPSPHLQLPMQAPTPVNRPVSRMQKHSPNATPTRAATAMATPSLAQAPAAPAMQISVSHMGPAAASAPSLPVRASTMPATTPPQATEALPLLKGVQPDVPQHHKPEITLPPPHVAFCNTVVQGSPEPFGGPSIPAPEKKLRLENIIRHTQKYHDGLGDDADDAEEVDEATLQKDFDKLVLDYLRRTAYPEAYEALRAHLQGGDGDSSGESAKQSPTGSKGRASPAAKRAITPTIPSSAKTDDKNTSPQVDADDNDSLFGPDSDDDEPAPKPQSPKSATKGPKRQDPAGSKDVEMGETTKSPASAGLKQSEATRNISTPTARDDDLGELYNWWRIHRQSASIARHLAHLSPLKSSSVPHTALQPTSAMAAQIAISAPADAVRVGPGGLSAKIDPLLQDAEPPATARTSALQAADQLRKAQQAQIERNEEARKKSNATPDGVMGADGRVRGQMPADEARRRMSLQQGMQMPGQPQVIVNGNPNMTQEQIRQHFTAQAQVQFAQQQQHQQQQVQYAAAQQQHAQALHNQHVQMQHQNINQMNRQVQNGMPQQYQVSNGMAIGPNGQLVQMQTAENGAYQNISRQTSMGSVGMQQALSGSGSDSASVSGRNAKRQAEADAEEVAKRQRVHGAPVDQQMMGGIVPPPVPNLTLGPQSGQQQRQMSQSEPRPLSAAERNYSSSQVQYLREVMASTPEAGASPPSTKKKGKKGPGLSVSVNGNGEAVETTPTSAGTASSRKRQPSGKKNGKNGGKGRGKVNETPESALSAVPTGFAVPATPTQAGGQGEEMQYDPADGLTFDGMTDAAANHGQMGQAGQAAQMGQMGQGVTGNTPQFILEPYSAISAPPNQAADTADPAQPLSATDPMSWFNSGDDDISGFDAIDFESFNWSADPGDHTEPWMGI